MTHKVMTSDLAAKAAQKLAASIGKSTSVSGEWWKDPDPSTYIDEIGILLDVAEEIGEACDENEVIDIAVLNINEVGFPNVMISLLDEGTRPNTIRAVQTLGEEWDAIKEITVRDYPGEDVLAKVLERRVAKYIPDSRKDPEVDAEAASMSGIISQYIIPLFVKEARIGTLQIHMGECQERPVFACRIIDALGRHLSLAISRFRTQERLNDANEMIMANSRRAIANEVASTIMHQLLHEIDAFKGKLSAELAKQENRQDSVAYKALKKLDKELLAWSGKLRSSLGFLGPNTEDNTVVCVNAVIQDTLDIWYEHIRAKNCGVKFLKSNDDIKVYIRPSFLKELLACLFVNSLQAHARKIVISADSSRECLGGLEGEEEEEEEEFVVVTVSDDGEGISEKDRDEIFKYGFTTKKKRGTGMGMYITKMLATAMSGDIVLEKGGKSSGHKETLFKIVLPLDSAGRVNA